MAPTLPHLLLMQPQDVPWQVYTLAAVTVLYVAVIRPILRRKKDPLDKPLNMSLAQQRAVEREMSNLLVELSQMARQITAQLDTRSAKLELLMQQADQKIAELRRLAGQAKSAGGGDGEKPADRSAAETLPPPPQIDPRHAEVYALADAGRTPPEIAQKLDRPRGEVELILALRPRRSIGSEESGNMH